MDQFKVHLTEGAGHGLWSPQHGGPGDSHTKTGTLVVTSAQPHWCATCPQSEKAPGQPRNCATGCGDLQCGCCRSSFPELPTCSTLWPEPRSQGTGVVTWSWWCQPCRSRLSGVSPLVKCLKLNDF